MTYQEFCSELQERVYASPYERQLAFALAICKKLYFDYKRFTQEYCWGDADILIDAIKLCSDSANGSKDVQAIQAMIPKVDAIAPHMDDFGSELGSYALNASAAVYETLYFIVDNSQQRICDVARYYTDTIDMKIQEDETLPETEIDNHPLMIEARNFVLDMLQ